MSCFGYLQRIKSENFLNVAAVVLSLCFVLPAYSSSVGILIESKGESKGAPAVDLIYQGRPLDRDHAVDLATKGVDLSRLDPAPATFNANPDSSPSSSDPTFTYIWSPDANLPAVEDDSIQHYPENGSTVSFESVLSSTQGIFRSRVLAQEPGSEAGRESGKTRAFQMIAGLNAHASLARNALLRRLGYPIPSPHYYSSLKIQFKDIARRTSFLDSLSDGTLTARKRWIRDLPDTLPEVTLQDVVLEPAQIDIQMYHWGVVPASHLKGRRAVRALIVPLVLLDVPESVNLYSYELGKILNQAVLLTYAYADSFGETTFQDARWIARKIADLSRKDLEEIVKAGHYPADVAALVTEKLVARRNQMVQLFDLSDSLNRGAKKLPYNTKISVGNVVSGKLTVGAYDGYAARFMYGDPDAPLRKSEVGKYLLIETISSGVAALSSEINNYLQVQSESGLQTLRQQDLLQQFLIWASKNPGVPYSQSVSSWGGPFGGFGIHASRDVVSGTYYGSEAKIQLVDNVGISASVGFYGQVDGIAHLVPSVTGNLTVQRNYLHVRPVVDMTTALKSDWTALFMPHFINHLAAMLDDSKSDPGTVDSSSTSDPTNPIDAGLHNFLDHFKEGEMLVVTDTIVAAVQGNINIPIPLLLDPALMQFNPSVGIGVGTSPTVLRRTTLMRTADGVQVYLQTSGILDFEIELNFNWWLNVIKVSHQNKRGLGDTKAFVLDKEPDSADERRKLSSSLKGLIRWNDSEVLEEDFKDYEVKHDSKVSIDKAKFLWWKAYRLEEEHRVLITPPGHKDHVRTLFLDRFVVNQGLDGYSFFSDIVAAASQGFANLPGTTGLNPANSFLGSARWVSVTTESETTPAYKKDPICAIEHHWAGWLLEKDSLMTILDSIEAKVRPLNLDKPLIRRDEFSTTKMLQMYEINSVLVIYESGQDKITKLLLDPSIFKVVNDMVDLEGIVDYERWCNEPNRKNLNKFLSINSFSGKENGHKEHFNCLKPWMKKALGVRAEFLAHKPDTAEGLVRWKTRLIRKLERYMEFHKFLKWVGKDNYFFQIKVSGFRTHDENGDTEYVSDSLGTLNDKEGAGAFHDFAKKYGISANELYAHYLSEGY